AIFAGDSYRAIAQENVRLYFTEFVASGVGVVFGLQVFARFLLGLYVGRRNWPRRLTELRPHLRRLLPWAVGVGIIGNATTLLLDRDSPRAYAAAPLEEAGILA